MFTQLLETEEQEAARFARAPEGSKTRLLSTLPVTIDRDVRGLAIELPRHPGDDARMIVVPYREDATMRSTELPRRRDSWWTCIVIASEHPSYPVGGNDITVSHAELRRGQRVQVGDIAVAR